MQIYIDTTCYVLAAAICIALNEQFADIKNLLYSVKQCLCLLKIIHL